MQFLFFLTFLLSSIKCSSGKLDGGKSFSKDFNAGYDHRAHSVPGGPYSVLDTKDSGKALVKLVGSNSHTHFFNPTTGEVGRITNYEWVFNGKVICKTANCNAVFKRGSHRVKLTVWDSTGDVAKASTAVYVMAPNRPGVQFLFFPRRLLFPKSSVSGGKPTFSVIHRRISYFTKTDFPAFLREIPFSAKIYASLKFPVSGVYQLRLECGGADCNLFVEGRQIGRTRHKERKIKAESSPMFVRAGNKAVHIVFVRRSHSWPDPNIVLWWRSPYNTKWHLVPATSLSRNPAAYPPVIHSVTPNQGSVGGIITLIGSSFVEVSKVTIGKDNCVAVDVKNEFKLKCVLPGGSGTIKIKVYTSTGKESNGLIFNYITPKMIKVNPNKRRLSSNLLSGKWSPISGGNSGSKKSMIGSVGYYQPIKFTETTMKWTTNKEFQGKQLTSITMGPDLKYYIGSLNGFVHVITITDEHKVKDSCRSANLGYTRSVIGLAFNPADYPKIKLYASTSVLDWGVKKLMTPFHGWRNGEVVTLKPRNNKAACMVMTKTIITGLPVSNHDHGVNTMFFNSFGSLLISVGGGTNAGISTPNDFMGGVPDSPLSGALLITNPDAPDYNGKIEYDKPWNPATTKKKSGMIEVFASGLRNSMGALLHSNGRVYATDNGANPGYGAKSTNCKGGSQPSVMEPDSFKMLPKGSYQGYANVNRGKSGDWRQCVHHSPWSKSEAWTKPLALLEPSTNGIVEYTANTFGAQMRGDVLATKFSIQSTGRTYRIQLGDEGGVKSVSTLTEHSGLTPAMSPRGAIIMPRVYQGSIAVLLPQENNPGATVVTSVFPIRGRRKGGFRVTITGWNLYPPLTAYFGGKKCTNPGDFHKYGRKFSCILPPGFGKVPVVVKRNNGHQSRSYGWEFWYMEL